MQENLAGPRGGPDRQGTDMRIGVMAGVLCAVATPAWAQRALETPAGGVRLELVAGWDRPVMRLQGTLQTVDKSYQAEMTAGKSGASYGGEVGYDYATSQATFIGAYAGVAGSTARFCTSILGGDAYCARAGRNLTLGLRAGLMSRGVAFYAKGGWSNAQIHERYTVDLHPEFNAEDSTTGDGFHVGLGLQARLPGHAYAKVEYVFTNYNGAEAQVVGNGYRVTGKLDYDRHQISGGLGVRF